MTGWLRDQLEAVRIEYGALTPPNTVAAARPEDAPLHPRFTWDDSVAGERWREVEARELIRSVLVTYKETDRGKSSVRGYVSVPKSETTARQYVPTEEALLDPLTRELVLLDARRELRAFRVRYGHLEEYAALLAAHLEEVRSA